MCEPDDIKFRQMIVQELDASMLVEAGAGSGKTMSLVNRMLALIGEGKCTVDRMAAVTFTRKAAAEMKGRFQIRLEEALRKEKDALRKGRYQSALQKMELLFSGTIHSFCARLLRERPIEARLDPDFKELEEEENAILKDRCWSEYLEGLQGTGTPALETVLELGIDPSELMDTYRNITLFPEVEVVRKKLDLPDFGKEKRLLRKYLNDAAAGLPGTVPEKGWDDLQDILRQALRQIKHLDLNRDQNFIKVITGLNKSAKVTQNRWPDKEVAKEEQARFDGFREEVITPSLKRWQEYCHYFIMELIIPVVDYFRRFREKNSLMNFHDLLFEAALLLRGNPEVRRYFQERFTHILIDEFQDTDPVQAEVILYLTGDDPEEKSWHRVKVKPGNLFIVGDPKQSIFRFRRADIDTYNEVKRVIKDSGGLVISLTTNFRSLASVCDWINPIFKKKLPVKGDQYQPAFEPLSPYKQTKGGGIKRNTINKVYWNNQAEAARQDAERIALWIDWALRGNFKIIRAEEEVADGKNDSPGPGDFMVLLRYKAHLPIYARALEARGIPYEISGGGAFNESEEILHLLNLLAAIAKPEDQVALAATLRGPFYGVSDDLLYRFRSEGGTFYFLAPKDQCKDEEARKQIEAIFAEFREFYHWARTKPPGAAFIQILDRLGIVPLTMTREMGESRTGNLLKFLEISFWEASRGITSFGEMVDRLHEYYSEIEVEEMSVEPGKKDVVRIMNLHKAKGLEAPVVFLADPLKYTAHDPDLHISRLEKQGLGFFVAYRRKGEYVDEIVGLPPDWQKYVELEQKYQEAEADRLLYVATTRAKQLLVISRYPEKEDKGAWISLYPYLGKADELEMPKLEERVAVKKEIPAQEFTGAKERIARHIEISKLQSYKTVAVTTEAKASSDGKPFVKESGQGMSWGRIVHRILENLAKNKTIDLNLLVENLLKEEDRSPSEKDSLIALIKVILASDLWIRAKKAEKTLVEVPFSHTIEEEGKVQVISGVIDLVFKEKEGWVIADYKSDKIDGNLDALVAYYRPQVDMYRDLWQKMTGEKVKEAGLYFIDAAKWVSV